VEGDQLEAHALDGKMNLSLPTRLAALHFDHVVLSAIFIAARAICWSGQNQDGHQTRVGRIILDERDR
jgi:hypothetical protein